MRYAQSSHEAGEALFRPLSDKEAGDLLDTILTLRRDASNEPDNRKYVSAAISFLQRLTEGVGGWAVEQYAGTLMPEQFDVLPVEAKRALIARHLTTPLMQPGATKELSAALIALNGDQIDPLLQPTDSGRRGA